MHASEIAVVGVVLLLLLPPWLTVRDMWRRPATAWTRAGRSRWAWTAVAVLLPMVGPALYLRVARPDLRSPARP